MVRKQTEPKQISVNIFLMYAIFNWLQVILKNTDTATKNYGGEPQGKPGNRNTHSKSALELEGKPVNCFTALQYMRT